LSRGVVPSPAPERATRPRSRGGSAGDQRRFPTGIAVDADGVIYIADERNDRIRKVFPGGASVGGRILAEGTGAAVVGATVNLYAASDLGTPVRTATITNTAIYGFSVPTGDYKIEVVGGPGFESEWFDGSADGASGDDGLAGLGRATRPRLLPRRRLTGPSRPHADRATRLACGRGAPETADRLRRVCSGDRGRRSPRCQRSRDRGPT